MKHFHILIVGIFCLITIGIKAQGITINNCTEFPVCMPFNSCTSATASIWLDASTTCFNQNVNFTYKVDFGNDGTFEIQDMGDTVTQNFPIGLSRISWRATSNCGHVATCNQVISVKDCQAPNLICRNGITQSLDNNCSMIVSAQQFVLTATDNCTPSNQLVYGLRKAGTGTGFPPHDTISYHLCDNGTNIVEMWIKDAVGNINQCANYVLVQDNSNFCPCIQTTDLTIKGCARTSTNTKLNTYRVHALVQGSGTGVANVNKQEVVTSLDSCFTMPISGLPAGLNGTVRLRAARTDMMTNGVTAYDLVLISRHILNLEPMTTIYQVLAADVNRSQTVTTFDIVEIRKTILGTKDTFPAVPAWQFIRPVADPSQLVNFAAVKDTFMVSLNNLSGVVTRSGFNWIGIKSADIDRTASLTGEILEERNGPTLLMTTKDRWVKAGEQVTVPIALSESVDLTAWQLAIQPRNSATITGVEGLPEEAYALQPDGGVRMLWMDDNPGVMRAYHAGEHIAQITVKAQQAGWLSQLLESDPNAPVEAITSAVQVRPVAFQFVPVAQEGNTATIYQPYPNPFSGQLAWPLLLDKDETVRLQVFDAAGRAIYEESRSFQAGYQVFNVDLSTTTRGSYSWRLIAGATVATGKTVRY